MHVLKFEAIGTTWEILFPDANEDSLVAQNLSQLVPETITEFDKNYSRFRNDSLIQQFQNVQHNIAVPEELVEMLLYYIPLYHLSNGKFTPTIGSLLEQKGYDATYSFMEGPSHSPPDLLQAIEIHDNTTISVLEPVLLDLGALGKGYLVDKVSLLIRSALGNDTSFTINAGGDIYHLQTKEKHSLTVGLEHPSKPDRVIGTVPIRNEAICSSAGNRRKWRQYHHIMDPLTQVSVNDTIATWVIAQEAVVADALATAMFFIEPERLRSQYQFEFCRISNNQVSASGRFQEGLLL
ncbi:MAG: FAD:protein FMN transferase [Patescibacteria group bacterium]